MIQWKEEIVIATNIEKVWSLFLDKNIKKIMPKVEEHTLIEKREEDVGAKHRQTYREGKRLETYIVDTLAYEDLAEKKQKQISFVLGKAFEITLAFTLFKIDDTHTKFIYEGQNKGVNFVGRAMLKLGSEKSNNKVVEEFMEKVKEEALKV
ncbi:SRPBCC family protein [Bacillus sp. DTU_2020_1000418_1_SI_GHA_SEK_038]|uniref:SRPBCC family protein n=1 Tax=Bacillus sp. DTU_2020_1000418_1_SI_GHA_SEK_038 TaxID=3077585 RepID=UPI0028E533E6|nr:SRPBCC family protein [Bacillus sp. DTU_2020_1000418_1_SI_GHA_SEK_038]WNS76186.1 SRPBCC family protein [Bacillus sp. DTU_2020_1000418_1_SI_GHA_SEK_038]